MTAITTGEALYLLFKKTYGKEGDAVDSGQWVHSKENLRFTEFNRIENYRELQSNY